MHGLYVLRHGPVTRDAAQSCHGGALFIFATEPQTDVTGRPILSWLEAQLCGRAEEQPTAGIPRYPNNVRGPTNRVEFLFKLQSTKASSPFLMQVARFSRFAKDNSIFPARSVTMTTGASAWPETLFRNSFWAAAPMRLKSRNKFVDAPQRFWGRPVSYCRPCTGGTQRPARKFDGPFDKTARGLANHFS
jgi:hypothetical protein